MPGRSLARSKRYDQTRVRMGDFGDVTRESHLNALAFDEAEQPPRLEQILVSSQFEAFSGMVILANVLLIVIETDARAIESMWESHGEESVTASELAEAQRTLTAVAQVNVAFLAYFTLELLARMFVHKFEFFYSGWNINDLAVVSLGIIGELASAAIQGSGVEGVSLLRSLRMIRLLRLTRILISFPELYTLVQGLANCMRTLLWAAGLIFLTLTVWSIIAVEYVNPLMPGITQDGHYDTCGWCPTAFRSVMFSNLTFFQIASGDGWSLLARPVIERYSWSVTMFLSIIFIVNFGMLNLIVAAIVDAAASARENDSENLAKQRNKERDLAWRTFAAVCGELDTDKSGQINFKELVRGLEDNPTLKANFGIMGVEEEDLKRIFQLLDEDNSGELSYDEFHTQLYNMKTLEVKTTLFYMKRYMEYLQKQMIDQKEAIQKVIEAVAPEGEEEVASVFERIFWDTGDGARDVSGDTRYGSAYWPDSVDVALLDHDTNVNACESAAHTVEVDAHEDFVRHISLGFSVADCGSAVNGTEGKKLARVVQNGFNELTLRAGSLVGVELELPCDLEAEEEAASECLRPACTAELTQGVCSLLDRLDERHSEDLSDAVLLEHYGAPPADHDRASV